MRWGLPALLCGALIGFALPAAAAPPKLELLPGQAFRVAGTRVGCWVVGSAASPSVFCALWGRTTRIIPGTLLVRTGQDAVEVFQRPLDGELSLLAELAQPPRSAPAPTSLPVVSRPGRTTTLFEGDTASLPGTDLACSIVRRTELGARCGRVDPTTGQLVPTSALVMVTEENALASRVNPRGLPSTVFYQRQPFIPSATTVTRELGALTRAAHRLAALRRVYHGSHRGYVRARAGFRAIATDLRNDRFIAACEKFTPLLYNGFYLPRGSVADGAGHLYLASVQRIERALCT